MADDIGYPRRQELDEATDREMVKAEQFRVEPLIKTRRFLDEYGHSTPTLMINEMIRRVRKDSMSTELWAQFDEMLDKLQPMLKEVSDTLFNK